MNKNKFISGLSIFGSVLALVAQAINAFASDAKLDQKIDERMDKREKEREAKSKKEGAPE